MRYIYINKSDSPRIVTLVSQTNSSASHINLGIGSKIELDYPGLEMYVPHLLSRIDESGTDISHLVLRQRENLKEHKSKSIESVKLEEVNVQTETVVLTEPQVNNAEVLNTVKQVVSIPQNIEIQQPIKKKEEKVTKSSIFKKKDKLSKV